MAWEVAEAERVPLGGGTSGGCLAAAGTAAAGASPEISVEVPLRMALRSLEAVRDLGRRLRLREAWPFMAEEEGGGGGFFSSFLLLPPPPPSPPSLLLLAEEERRRRTSRNMFIFSVLLPVLSISFWYEERSSSPLPGATELS